MSRHSSRRLAFQDLERREVLSTMVMETEPNNRKTQADVVSLDTVDQSAQIQGNIASRKDEDYFRLRPAASGVLNLTVADGTPLVEKISVETAGGRKLFESEPNDGIHSGAFQVVANQEVFIRVRGQSKTIGDYSVQLSLTSDPLPPGGGGSGGGGGGITSPPSSTFVEVEGNNSVRQANRVALPTTGTLQIQGTSQSSADKDFYAVTPATSGVLQVNVASTGAGVAKLSVESAGGLKYFETEPNDGVNAGSFAVTAGTTYYFRLRSIDARLSPYLVDLAMA